MIYPGSGYEKTTSFSRSPAISPANSNQSQMLCCKLPNGKSHVGRNDVFSQQPVRIQVCLEPHHQFQSRDSLSITLNYKIINVIRFRCYI